MTSWRVRTIFHKQVLRYPNQTKPRLKKRLPTYNTLKCPRARWRGRGGRGGRGLTKIMFRPPDRQRLPTHFYGSSNPPVFPITTNLNKWMPGTTSLGQKISLSVFGRRGKYTLPHTGGKTCATPDDGCRGCWRRRRRPPAGGVSRRPGVVGLVPCGAQVEHLARWRAPRFVRPQGEHRIAAGGDERARRSARPAAHQQVLLQPLGERGRGGGLFLRPCTHACACRNHFCRHGCPTHGRTTDCNAT